MSEARWMWADSYTHADIVSNRGPAAAWIAEFHKDLTFVYVIGRNEGPVKIGISSRPDKRLGSIQNGCPFPIEILYKKRLHTRLKARSAEQYFHKLHFGSRLAGEWFNMTAAVAIDRLRSFLIPEDPYVGD